MSLSQMKVFNEYIMPLTIETLGQMVEKFNGASNGSIRLTTEGFDGDFLQESFFAAIHGAQRRVNRYGSNTAANETDLTQLQHNTVKVAGGFGPIRFEPSQLTWLNEASTAGIEVASRNFAEAMLQDQLNSAIAALVAAISNGGAATLVADDTTGVTQSVINKSHALFGDRSGDLVAQIMTGAMYHKLIGDNLTNTTNLFQAQNVRVVDILGKAVIVTDAPALNIAQVAEPETPARNAVLSLAQGAAVVFDGSDVISNIDTSNGKQRIETTMQVDYTFGLGLKGYSWDTANGGKSPTDAALATGTNWDKVASDIKHTAGVIAVGDASK